MYYCLSCYPQFSVALAEAIDAIRNKYDPTAPYYPPHITVVFPTHDRIGLEPLSAHLEDVLSRWKAFTIRLGGFEKQPNHWMLLRLQRGEAEFKELYRDIHTGILESGSSRGKYRPHISLGLFTKVGIARDWFNPQESDFDPVLYQEALSSVGSLPLAEDILIDKFVLGALRDTVIEWVRGKRPCIPDDAHEIVLREFCLQSPGSRFTT